MRKTAGKSILLGLVFALLSVGNAAAEQQASAGQAEDDGTGRTATAPERAGRLYVVATSHLDTQWRWTIQTTIDEYIPATLRDNFALIEKYSDYIFSFEGAFRYQLMQEYFPQEYARLKQYIADGRWRVAGSWLDAVDVNVPSPESLIRQALLGNGFFRKEFGVTSLDIYLPDCFGFGFALPSVAAHCGLKQFSTQKLTWGSSVGIPFDIGLWEGVDGSTVVAALDPGAYVSSIESDLSADSTWAATIDRQEEVSGLRAAYKYFGTGDQGGAPDEESVAWLERSIAGDGPLSVVSSGSDQLARDLNDEQIAALPRYRGEMLMTSHGAGCYTSQAAMKRWNRKNELLADAAERAAVIAHWLGGAIYPRETLREAWTRFLWHQFHDDLTGTSIPEAYVFSWNDLLISLDRFATTLSEAVGAISRLLDTRTDGVPLVVYNPLSIEREDPVQASVVFANGPPRHVRVFDPDGREVPAQVAGRRDGELDIVFLARVPSVGFAVYDVRPARKPCELDTGLRCDPDTGMLENARYLVAVRPDGIASIFDKRTGRDLLAGSIALQLLDNEPPKWAAWEVAYDDLMREPRVVVGATTRGEQIDDSLADIFTGHEIGPARASLSWSQQVDGSTFIQTVSLTGGDAGDRIEIDLDIDWRTPATLLKATFPLTARNEHATYDLGLGTIQRPTNRPELHEVPAQQWADLSAADGSYGVTILNDCRYGWDKPDDHTLRLTLLHTPAIAPGWKWIQDQRSQDLGRHRLTLAVCGHEGDWRTNAPWQGRRLNQPLLAFRAPEHRGKLGKEFSFLQVNAPGGRRSPGVAVQAIKLAEESDEIVVRLQELRGERAPEVSVALACQLRAAREVDGAEQALAAEAVVADGGLRTDLEPYRPRAFALRLDEPRAAVTPPLALPVDLPHDTDGISHDDDRTDGDFDGEGYTLSGDLLPETVDCAGTPFRIGSTSAGSDNVVTCRGQTVPLPEGDHDRLYLLAAAVGEPAEATFTVGGERTSFWIPEYDEPFGQWDSRLVGNDLVEAPAEIVPAFLNTTPLGWVGTHRHTPEGGNEPYVFTHLYRFRLDLPPGARELTLPRDDRVRLVAATVAHNENDATVPAWPLYDRCDATSVSISSSRRAFMDSVLVTMQSPNPTPEIRYTLDGSEPTAASPLYDEPFWLNETAVVRATAFSPSLPRQSVVQAACTRLEPRPAMPAVDLEGAETGPGLQCRYYEGAFDRLPDFADLEPTSTSAVAAVAVPPFARDEDIGLVFAGYLEIPRDGLYTFHLWSDDGSALHVDGEMVVDNDGLHGRARESVDLALAAGLHPIEVTFFQHLGGVALELWWEGPGIERQQVSEEMFRHAE